MKNTIALIFTAGALFLTGCATCHHASTAWEYKKVTVETTMVENELNRLSGQGWALVCFTPQDSNVNSFIVKKRK